MTNQEKRQDRRVATSLSLKYTVMGDTELGNAAQRTTTTCLSVGGLAFKSELSIAMGTRLALVLTLPGKGETLYCEAVVSRIIREHPSDGCLEYAVAFDEDTLEDPKALLGIVRNLDILPLLEHMIKIGATDLHLTANSVPIFRVDQKLAKISKPHLSKEAVESLITAVLSSDRMEQLQREREICFPFMVPELGRWRVSAYYQRGCVEATFHAIDLEVPTLSSLGLPSLVGQLAQTQSGIIAVTGSSGSGRHTTTAAMIDEINRHEERVIVTLEDPIQYVHANQRSIIKQREVGNDVSSMSVGMENILRQDVDVILIDEVLDAHVMDMVLRAAESGVLVIACFPSADLASTIKKIIGYYPEDKRMPMLRTLAGSLQGVISQRLLPSLDEREKVIVPEVVTVTDGIREAIWTNKLGQVANLMSGSSECITLDASLRTALAQGKITYEHAAKLARDPEGLRRNVAM